jgi:predicted ATPase
MTDQLFIITGGPGSGKTTLIEAFAARGFTTTIEAGRAIIKEQITIGSNALPWTDPLAFAELMLAWDIRSYEMIKEEDCPVIFDRGIPDVASYLKLMNVPVPDPIQKAATDFRYNRTVFIAPPWPEIFAQDTERKQTFEEAIATYEMLAETYKALDYELVTLPLTTVEERVEFLLQQIIALQSSPKT